MIPTRQNARRGEFPAHFHGFLPLASGGEIERRLPLEESLCGPAALGQPAEPEPPRARTARTGGQAHDRGDGVRSEDHPPLAYQQGGGFKVTTIRSTAICWSSTRPRWSMFSWCRRCS